MPGPTRSADGSRSRQTGSALPPLIVIAGATASGKTALSLALAQAIERAEIVCADSRQVYRGMDIGTAKPSPSEQAAVVHHGLDLVDPDQPFSVADYRHHALDALHAVAARGGVALLVGGTGLYLRSVMHGLPFDAQAADPGLRATLEARLDSEGVAALVEELERRDPRLPDGLDRRNPRRVLRSLERAILTGTASPPPPRGYAAPICRLGLHAEPGAHRAAIARRARRLFQHGLLEESAALRARYDEALPAFSAIGYREAFDVLDGRYDVETAVERVRRRTWSYARRQRTWFRSEAGFTWLPAGEGSVAAARGIVTPFLEAALRGTLSSV